MDILGNSIFSYRNAAAPTGTVEAPAVEDISSGDSPTLVPSSPTEPVIGIAPDVAPQPVPTIEPAPSVDPVALPPPATPITEPAPVIVQPMPYLAPSSPSVLPISLVPVMPLVPIGDTIDDELPMNMGGGFGGGGFGSPEEEMIAEEIEAKKSSWWWLVFVAAGTYVIWKKPFKQQ